MKEFMGTYFKAINLSSKQSYFLGKGNWYSETLINTKNEADLLHYVRNSLGDIKSEQNSGESCYSKKIAQNLRKLGDEITVFADWDDHYYDMETTEIGNRYKEP